MSCFLTHGVDLTLRYRLAEIFCVLSCSSSRDSDKVTLRFTDIAVRLENRDILKKVYGTVRPGETLAVMGSSGKTIINIIIF